MKGRGTRTNYKLDRNQKQFLKNESLRGWEIVDATARLCVMNLYMHGIGSDKSPITVGDSLASPPPIFGCHEFFDYQYEHGSNDGTIQTSGTERTGVDSPKIWLEDIYDYIAADDPEAAERTVSLV